MATLSEITNYLNNLLRLEDFEDESQNGLQVESNSKKIRKIAVAVDSGLSVINQAIKLKCQILIVHHGLLWNKPLRVSGFMGDKIRRLIENGCSLYAAHLPLDAHLKHGNAALLAQYLGLTNIKPFCLYRSRHIGVKAVNSKTLTLEEISAKCAKMCGAIKPIVLPFGKKDIKNIGIVTGSGSFALDDCVNHKNAADNIDLLISGEAKQSAYHTAKELKVNALFAGHYATETFGVLALGKELERKFKIKSLFIDEGTGI